MSTTHRSLLLLTAVLAILAPAARAQTEDISIRAELSNRAVYLGDSIALQITVQGADDPDQPEFPAIDAVDVTSQGGGRQLSSYSRLINGRMQEVRNVSYVFNYALTPTREGAFVIPPIRVRVSGRDFTTEPLEISAVEPPTDPDSLLRIELDTENAYVGQPVRARVTWFFDGSVQNVSFRASDLPTTIDVLPLPVQASRGEQIYRFNAFGAEIQGIVTNAIRDARRSPALVFEIMFIPRASGEYEIGPAVVSFIRNRAARSERLMSRSQAPTLRVNALPTEGRPANFTGLVGAYALDLTASPTDVNVGDPITLDLTILGPEPLSAVEAPDLSIDPDIAERFKPSADGWERTGQDRVGRRSFQTTIRARTADIDAIPPIRLPYFDPVSGQYRNAQTDEIPLEVSQSRRVTAADAIMAPGRTAPPSSRTPERADTGVWALETEPARLLASNGFDLVDWTSRPVVVTLLAAPPAAYALASVVVLTRRRADPAAARRRRMRRRARTLLAGGNAPESVRAWASACTGAPEDSITAADVLALADQGSPGDAALLSSVLLGGEQERFGSRPPTPDADPGEIRAAMRRLWRASHAQGGAA